MLLTFFQSSKIPDKRVKPYRLGAVLIILALAGCKYTFEEDKDKDDTPPHVVSAISKSNTEVLIQFSEAIQGGEGGAENPLNFSIVSEESQAQIPVISASFSNPHNSLVLLTTMSQSGVKYKVTASNIRDEDGLPISEPTILVDPSSTTFTGTEPTGDAIADFDGDGLSDHVELVGWSVVVKRNNGESDMRHVTSDPLIADTDGDGVTDNEELHGGMDPRNSDTDGDTLTDNQEWNIIYSDATNQDTDGDGTQDGFEFFSFRTSPILADTDGDQINDTDEVLGRNRDPRIADIPRAGIKIGEVRLQLDERFTFENVDGSTETRTSVSNSTLSQSKNTRYEISNEAVTQHVAGGEIDAGSEAGAGGRGAKYINIKGNYQYTNSNTFSASRASSIESQRTYERSLSKAQEFSTTNTVTRTLDGAGIDVDLTIYNSGDLSFTISNIEITVLQRDRQSSRRFIPVATLIANTTLITGEAAEYNLGPFTPERGPIIFSSRDVFPNLVEELMKAPSGLIFKVANFDMTDEYGRVFTFANQIARDRNAGIIVDYGDGEAQRNLVATALQPDVNGFGSSDPDEAFRYVGGFNSDGAAIGIPLDFALQDTLGLTKNSTIQDGIVAGPNRRADTRADGDDVQVIPVGTTGVGVGSIVISAGQNGILETIPSEDDQAEVTTGYGTSLSCNAFSDNAGQLCSVDSECTGNNNEDENSVASCSGPEVLERFNGYRNGDLDRQWVVMTNREIPAGADFGKVILKPGADIFLAFIQDLDEDGLFAREEYLFGSTDSRADNYDNGTFGENFSEEDASAEIPDNIADSKDTDRDGIGDFAEVRVGWKVNVDGAGLRQVYSSPRLRDSDGDGLLDPQEQDLRRYCKTDPQDATFVDPRKDALCSFQSSPVLQENAIAIIAGPNGIADSLADVGDQQLIAQGQSDLNYNSVVIGLGNDEIIQTTLAGDDLYESITSVPPATDPSVMDSDLDRVSDFHELNGFDIGLSIRDGNNGESDTIANGDDIQKSFFGNPIKSGGIVILPGLNGTIDSVPGGDDRLQAATQVVTDPLRRDTDTDLVSDGRELEQGADPTDNSDGQDFRDSDQDGLTDSEENDLGWTVYLNGSATGTLVHSNPSLMDSDLDGLPDFIERDIRSNPNSVDTDADGISDYDEFANFERYFGLDQLYPGFFVNGSGSAQYGTELDDSDSDNDGLTDSFELLEGYRVLLAGEQEFRQVFTNPLDQDTDFDGRTDYQELHRTAILADATDATDPDTDDDGRTDGREHEVMTNPLVPDVHVTVKYLNLELKSGPITYFARWDFNLYNGEQRYPGQLLSNHEMVFRPLESCIIRPNFKLIHVGNLDRFSNLGEASFRLQPGESFSLNGNLAAVADCTNPSLIIYHCLMSFNKSFSFEDILQPQGATRIETESLADRTCTADLTYQITVE